MPPDKAGDARFLRRNTEQLILVQPCEQAAITHGDANFAATVSIGVAPTTAKWHLENIFAKTGVARQADLVGLARSLAPPTRSSD
jgi:hypothetical protein